MEQGKDEKMNKKRANFTGTIGFVMAAAGSAVERLEVRMPV